MSSLRLTAVLTAILLAGLSGCGSNGHTANNTLIDRSRSIGPISFWETRAKIEAAYGKGRRATLPGRPHPTPITVYPAVSIGVLYYKNHAIYVETTARGYRTKSGLGVGSTSAKLRKNGAECHPDEGMCALVNASLVTTFFMNRSYDFYRPGTRAIRVVVGPLGN